jgi:hypothetical protein
MSEINLRALVKQVLIGTDLVGPDAVAEETFDRLTRGQYAPALRQTLHLYARTIIAERRRSPTPARLESTRQAQARGMGASAWLRGQRFTPSGWKMVRDMDAGDCLYVAGQLRRQADEDIAEAERWEKTAAEVGDGTIGDLFGGSE